MHPPRASTQPPPSQRWPCTMAASTCSRSSLLPRPATTTAEQKILECWEAQSSSDSPASILRTHPAGPAPFTASVRPHPRHQNSGAALPTSKAPVSRPVTQLGQRAYPLRSPTGRRRVQVELFTPSVGLAPPISISLHFRAGKTELRYTLITPDHS